MIENSIIRERINNCIVVMNYQNKAVNLHYQITEWIMNCVVRNYHVECPVGVYNVEECDEGLHRVKIDDSEVCDIDTTVPVEVVEGKKKTEFVAWLKEYFEKSKKLPSLELPSVCSSVFNEGKFRHKVWREIYRNLSFGETASYGEVARRVGSPGASQAVGTAMKTNPVSLVIPCHRVVRSGGDPGHYHGGSRDYLKIWLLQHEHNC